MPSFFDKLKPQPKTVTVAPEPVQSTVPSVETPKPVEVVPVPEPDFSNSLKATPFETAINLAKKYYDTARDSGQLTDEMKTKLANFTEVSNVLAAGWKTEQETNAAAEKAKLPGTKLVDSLCQGFYSDPYNSKPLVEKVRRDMNNVVINSADRAYKEEKMISDLSDTEIVEKLFKEGKLLNRVDLGNLYSGKAGVLDEVSYDFPTTESTKVLKAIGAIPQEAPNGGNFPKKENIYLAKLLQKDGRCTQQEAKVYNGQEGVEFTRPTDIDGVSVTVGVRKDTLTDRFYEYQNLYNYPQVSHIELNLSPEFYAKNLGIKPVESPVEKPVVTE